MAIPETQLETWSNRGSVTQSSTTYNTVKNVLEDGTGAYAAKAHEVFLQGSYGNATNIYAESDVDIVIRLSSDVLFYHDLTLLPVDQQERFKAAFSDATYSYSDFKREVFAHLKAAYGDAATQGDKAVRIAAGGGRRNSDVIACAPYRRYYKFNGTFDQSYDEGIMFYTADGTQIVNYPKQHAAHCVKKNQDTDGWYKPTVRVLKNMRCRMVDDGMIEGKTAPSYYIEGLLYNVPTEHFGESYDATFVNCYNWLVQADRDKWVTANEQYKLLHPSSSVTWRADKCDQFLTQLRSLWTDW